ncbi:DUF2948 family protein [Oceanibacterium hippocampi]|uniref:DUF2948 domain-containing protein n=1 Tax=Oceanibacterium hippocampi TaxID=745714 RepID=A0A1Y5S6L3_9PROT|nr:DUF2948 family protein [Oceanibacterium hippocampi]SLN31304.1 hypothetical protein OCH7691_01116 [Oceanibacterium hippocampi]
MANEKDQGTPLRLMAQDADDLTIVASALESAVTRPDAMTWRRGERRFAVLFNRFRWETVRGARRPKTMFERIQSGLVIDGVLSVSRQGFAPGGAEPVLELLTIAVEQTTAPAAQVTLVFAGGALVRLDVECIEAVLSDRGKPWTTPRKPDHGLKAE